MSRATVAALVVSMAGMFFVAEVDAGGAADRALPTPEELFALIRGSRERYETFDLAYREAYYLGANTGDTQTAPDFVVDVVWRRSGERMFQRVDYVKHQPRPPGVSADQVIWRWSDGELGWQLELSTNGSTSGIVDEAERIREISQTPAELALAPFSRGYLRYMPGAGERSEVKAVDGGRLMLVSTILDHPLRIEWTVDPALNYAPTECKVIGPDGAVQFHVESSDFREVKPGMWFPHDIVCRMKNFGVRRYAVKSVRVNEAIADDLLEHSFPPGTEVGDRIDGRTYTMWLGGTPRSMSAGMWWVMGALVVLIGVTIAAVWFVRGRRRAVATG